MALPTFQPYIEFLSHFRLVEKHWRHHLCLQRILINIIQQFAILNTDCLSTNLAATVVATCLTFQRGTVATTSDFKWWLLAVHFNCDAKI